MRHALVLSLVCLSLTCVAAQRQISVFAGTGEPGYAGDGGPATKAKLSNPFGVVRGPDGALYICDTGNHAIRRVDSKGIITTIAGKGRKGYSGDGGPAVEAELNEPYELRFYDDDLYVVEMGNHIVRRIEGSSKTIQTVAGCGRPGFGGDGGRASAAVLNQPHSIQFDTQGNLYICDIGNHRIRRVDPGTGLIFTFAGTGSKALTPDKARLGGAPLNGPRAIDFDRAGDLWLALREGNAVYRVDMKAGTIHHVAGTGKKGATLARTLAKKATFSGPKGISVGPDGNVYLADTEIHSILMIDVKRDSVEPVAGTGKRGDGPDGDPLKCKLARPHGVFVDADGSIFIGDSEADCVRVVRTVK